LFVIALQFMPDCRTAKSGNSCIQNPFRLSVNSGGVPCHLDPGLHAASIDKLLGEDRIEAGNDLQSIAASPIRLVRI
jgi:hypothetical protein